MNEPENATMTRAEERWLAAALEESFGGPEPPDLTGAILARRAAEGRSASRRKRVLAAALLAAGLATVALVPVLDGDGPAQDPDGSCLPLGIGAEWEYEVDGERYVERVLGSTRVGGREVYLLEGPPQEFIVTASAGKVRLWQGEGSRDFRFVAADEAGIWRFPGDPHRPSLAGDSTPEPLLPLPASEGASWEWTVSRLVRDGREGARVGPAPKEDVRRKATVVAVDEEVEVPAGRFSTVHVRVENLGGAVPVVEDIWYARGTGVVRVETRAGDGPEAPVVRRNLVRFTPGHEPFAWEADMPSLLAKSGELGARGMPDEVVPVDLDMLGLLLQSRFARLRWGDEEVIARVSFDGGVTLAGFDPSDLEDWNALVADEPLYEKPEGLAQVATEALAELAGRLHAARAGMEVVDPFDRDSVVIISGNTQVLGEMRVRSATGEEETLECHATIEDGRVTAIGLR